jgi:hypothetical protein
MKKIFKYRLPFMEVAQVEMPAGASILRIDGQEGALWIWAVVDPAEPVETRTFCLFKTGAPMPDDIDTYLYHGYGAIYIQMELMLYVFERNSQELFHG